MQAQPSPRLTDVQGDADTRPIHDPRRARRVPVRALQVNAEACSTSPLPTAPQRAGGWRRQAGVTPPAARRAAASPRAAHAARQPSAGEKPGVPAPRLATPSPLHRRRQTRLETQDSGRSLGFTPQMKGTHTGIAQKEQKTSGLFLLTYKHAPGHPSAGPRSSLGSADSERGPPSPSLRAAQSNHF